ncbi:hypothetical protein GOB17_26885 [Sinorhizobium meliloti]|uniref:hypothetical protein n=1 Tax=Rhizobium meliloti TaxID=382 RepID=UPI000FD88613|nr:hypothetical protein [Sinorhizobium meliloti]MDX2329312.1 hypothetical protein [Sinorhizobium medicae]MDW9583222.1 hypothetical protein [Sinorhizobium meliloti]MDX0185377.1 hypothetical protein [Sinorhizobium meliloti]MDX0283752.1 hypothetical protein [Sinorhizobium meliloti]RVL29943.1 hypothetical protein CN144_15030 [Sinorhizobium meliloti]
MADVKKTVEKAMPGWALERQSDYAVDSGLPETASDFVAPDDVRLREKYKRFLRGGAAPDAISAAVSESEPNAGSGELEWGKLRSKSNRDSHVGTKTVLFDKRTGAIKAVQG